MIGLLCFGLAILISPFRSKSRLEAENAVLRHQLIVLRRKMRGRPQLTNDDRWFFIQLYRWFPFILQVLTIIRPETLVRWHRAGFRCYWRWRSRALGGRPQIDTELRALIRRMSMENPLWGAPRIHGELLKLGFEVAQSSVAKYIVKRRGPPSQGWRTFLRNTSTLHKCEVPRRPLYRHYRRNSGSDSDIVKPTRMRPMCDIGPSWPQQFKRLRPLIVVSQTLSFWHSCPASETRRRSDHRRDVSNDSGDMRDPSTTEAGRTP